MHDFGEFTSWAFQAVIAGGVAVGVSILSQMRKSIEELNIKVASILEKTASHEKQIDRHDQRITKIEQNQ